MTPREQAAIAKAVEALEGALLLDPTCDHTDTERQGAIWTVCAQCHRRWADDEGGVKPDPPNQNIERIFAALAALRALGDGWEEIATLPEQDDCHVDFWHSLFKRRWPSCYFDAKAKVWRSSVGENIQKVVDAGYITHWQPLPVPPGGKR